MHIGTRVRKWKDGRRAAVLMAFDDGCSTHLEYAIPELTRRGMAGTFFIIPGADYFRASEAQWREAAKEPGIEFANHTFTHRGARTLEELNEEVKQCQQALRELVPGRSEPRLTGFCRPGGVPWPFSSGELEEIYARYNLVPRPVVTKPPSYESADQMLGIVDAAIEEGGTACLYFHGIGGDWIVTPLDAFLDLLAGLEERRDAVWVADLVSWHQYAAERDSLVIEELKAGACLRISMHSACDAQLYDYPLTFSTPLPKGWTACRVMQRGVELPSEIAGNAVQYNAPWSAGEVTIERLS
jgi:peptidoglycan/xylan/chitin deacetylase (PgdA/CDA1 family)